MSDVAFLLWSNKHGMWWKPNKLGYTPDIDEAGRYSEEMAIRCVVTSAMCGDLSKVTAMVAAPDNWIEPGPKTGVPKTELVPGVRLVAGPGPLVDVLSEAFTKLAAEKAARRDVHVCAICYAALPAQFDAFPETYCQHRSPDGGNPL